MRTFYVPPVQSERRGGCVSRDKPRKGYAHRFSNNFIFPPFHESSSLDSRPVLFSDIVTSSSFCDREANKQAAERDTGNAVNKLTFRPDPLGLKRKPVLGEFVLAPLLLSLSLSFSLFLLLYVIVFFRVISFGGGPRWFIVERPRGYGARPPEARAAPTGVSPLAVYNMFRAMNRDRRFVRIARGQRIAVAQSGSRTERTRTATSYKHM